MGALVAAIQNGTHDPHRAKYVEIFKLHAAKLASIITMDARGGYWHSSLLDASSFPSPEMTGTASFVYGMAFGINHGLLDRATYLPPVNAACGSSCPRRRCRRAGCSATASRWVARRRTTSTRARPRTSASASSCWRRRRCTSWSRPSQRRFGKMKGIVGLHVFGPVDREEDRPSEAAADDDQEDSAAGTEV